VQTSSLSTLLLQLRTAHACASRAIDETPSVSAGSAYRRRQRCRCVPGLATAIERGADE